MLLSVLSFVGGVKTTPRGVKGAHSSMYEQRTSVAATTKKGEKKKMETACGLRYRQKRWQSCQSEGGGSKNEMLQKVRQTNNRRREDENEPKEPNAAFAEMTTDVVRGGPLGIGHLSITVLTQRAQESKRDWFSFLSRTQ